VDGAFSFSSFQQFDNVIRDIDDKITIENPLKYRKEDSKVDVLIIYGYHPKEKFAIEVGEYLFKNNSSKKIKIVRYAGKSDRKTSTYNLRRFVDNFRPSISPLILHDDSKFEPFDGAIIYNAKSKEIRRKAAKYLLEFISEDGSLTGFGKFLTPNTNYNLIDIELNPRAGLEKAANLVKRFSKYLLRLYLNDGIKL